MTYQAQNASTLTVRSFEGDMQVQWFGPDRDAAHELLSRKLQEGCALFRPVPRRIAILGKTLKALTCASELQGLDELVASGDLIDQLIDRTHAFNRSIEVTHDGIQVRLVTRRCSGLASMGLEPSER